MPAIIDPLLQIFILEYTGDTIPKGTKVNEQV